MRRATYIALVCCCVFFPALQGRCADDETGTSPRGLEVPARRGRSVFHRARKDSPDEQLKYARELRDKGKARNAGRQYLALVHNWPSSPEAPVAQLEYAQLLDKRGKVQDAFIEYQYLIDNYAGSFDYDSVLRRQFEIASSTMGTPSRFLWVFKDDGNLEDALPQFEQITVNGPGWTDAPRAYFNIAVIYEKTGEYELAIDAYEAVRQRFPADPLAVDSAFREGNCLYRLTSGRQYDEYSMLMARGHFERIVKAYPTHKMAEESGKHLSEINARLSKAYWQRAAFYDRFGKHPKSALLAYSDFLDNFPDDALAEKARGRIADLKSIVVAREANAQPPSKAGIPEKAGAKP